MYLPAQATRAKATATDALANIQLVYSKVCSKKG